MAPVPGARASDEGESGRAAAETLLPPLPLLPLPRIFPSPPERDAAPSSPEADAQATETEEEVPAEGPTANDRDSPSEDEETGGRATDHFSRPLAPSNAVAPALFDSPLPQATTATDPSLEAPAAAAAAAERPPPQNEPRARSPRRAPSAARQARRTSSGGESPPPPPTEESVSAAPAVPRGLTESRRSRASRSCDLFFFFFGGGEREQSWDRERRLRKKG